MIFKTESWPDGRNWPNEIVLDVGSSMPTDVYGCDRSGEANGVRYVRKDVAGHARREIRRLRRALREIRTDTRYAIDGHAGLASMMHRVNGIATRALKGKKL